MKNYYISCKKDKPKIQEDEGKAEQQDNNLACLGILAAAAAVTLLVGYICLKGEGNGGSGGGAGASGGDAGGESGGDAPAEADTGDAAAEGDAPEDEN